MLLLTPYCSKLLLIFYSPSLSPLRSHSLLSLKFLSVSLSLLAPSLLQNPTHISLSLNYCFFNTHSIKSPLPSTQPTYSETAKSRNPNRPTSLSLIFMVWSLIGFSFFFFSIVVSDVVVGLGSRFGCDFGGKRLRLWVVVTVVMVVMAMAMVD